MVRAMVLPDPRSLACSTRNELDSAWRMLEGRRAFVPLVVAQPFWGKHPRLQDRLEAVDYDRQAGLDDPFQNELFKGIRAALYDVLVADSRGPLEVLSGFDEGR